MDCTWLYYVILLIQWHYGYIYVYNTECGQWISVPPAIWYSIRRLFFRCPVWYLLGVHLCVCISMFGTFATAECFVYCWTYRLEAVDEFNSIQSSRAHDIRSSFKIHRHYSKIHLFVFKLIHIGLTETIQFWTDSSSILFCARW